MKLSMFLMGDVGSTYADMVEQVCTAENLGFDGVWLAERYFANTDLLWSSPLVAASYLAAVTHKIRLGIAATILPFHHPFRIAFDTLTLDHLSHGRIDLGITRSSMDDDAHRGFNVSRDEAKERFDEAFSVLVQALRGEAFAFDGKHYHFDTIQPNPQPIQRPHPPLYLVANNQQSAEFAAANQLPVFLHGALNVAGVERAQNQYRHAAEQANGIGLSRQNLLNRFIYVGETNEQARAKMREPFLTFLNTRAPDLKAYLVKTFGADGVDFDFLADNICVFGDADTVTERLQTLSEQTGIGHLLGTFNLITLEHQECLASIRRFAEDVMPRLHNKPAVRHDAPEQAQSTN